MKLIELGGKYGTVVGNYAQVSDEDYEWLNQWEWHTELHQKAKLCYVSRTIKKKTIKIHRVIMDLDNPKIFVDHIDGNGLNNQRSNLRIATSSQNQANRKASGISKYLGVSPPYKNDSSWRARCKGEIIRAKTEIEAALAYNELAIKHHGEFAKLNIIK